VNINVGMMAQWLERTFCDPITDGGGGSEPVPGNCIAVMSTRTEPPRTSTTAMYTFKGKGKD